MRSILLCLGIFLFSHKLDAVNTGVLGKVLSIVAIPHLDLLQDEAASPSQLIEVTDSTGNPIEGVEVELWDFDKPKRLAKTKTDIGGLAMLGIPVEVRSLGISFSGKGVFPRYFPLESFRKDQTKGQPIKVVLNFLGYIPIITDKRYLGELQIEWPKGAIEVNGEIRLDANILEEIERIVVGQSEYLTIRVARLADPIAGKAIAQFEGQGRKDSFQLKITTAATKQVTPYRYQYYGSIDPAWKSVQFSISDNTGKPISGLEACDYPILCLATSVGGLNGKKFYVIASRTEDNHYQAWMPPGEYALSSVASHPNPAGLLIGLPIVSPSRLMVPNMLIKSQTVIVEAGARICSVPQDFGIPVIPGVRYSLFTKVDSTSQRLGTLGGFDTCINRGSYFLGMKPDNGEDWAFVDVEF